ncbi:monovalent cation:H+ antiporter, CPA1 (nhx1) [Massospora cicadina]|nr:monovalent cation:H+ antiporter, CPA1 (nhx1) [Massospora cicadina]
MENDTLAAGPINGTLVAGIDTTAQAEELYSSWAILIFIFLLSVTLFASYLLQKEEYGMFVGLIIRVLDDDSLRNMVSFKFTVFFNLLLPPIILNSGYELEREHFFKNMAAVIGSLVYVHDRVFDDGVNFVVDRPNPKLYAIIFGESMLNDSVAIVLFESLQHVVSRDTDLPLLLAGLGEFFMIFFGSLSIGAAMGMACALILKFTSLHQFNSLESCLVMLLAYATYFLSNTVHLSGIVSLLFCSIVLKHYAFINLSASSQRTTKVMFHILAQLSENFCFIYLGITLFTAPKEDYNLILILLTLIIVCVSRFCSIFPLSKLINYVMRRFYHNPSDAIPRSYQLMLFWAGLRGAVSFALAMEMESPNASLMRSTILIVVVLTVLFFDWDSFSSYVSIFQCFQ